MVLTLVSEDIISHILSLRSKLKDNQHNERTSGGVLNVDVECYHLFNRISDHYQSKGWGVTKDNECMNVGD